MIDNKIQIKTFKSYSSADDADFNNWIDENLGKINIKDIKEVATKEYLRIAVYYTKINK